MIWMLMLWIRKYFILKSMTSKVIEGLKSSFLALTQRWCFPLQIVWISLSLSILFSLPLSFSRSLSISLSISLFCSMQTLIYTQRNVFHIMKYDLNGHIYVAWFLKFSDLLIKLQRWLTFLWTTFNLVSCKFL